MIETLTAILVGVTIYYAWTTRRILQANEQAVAAMREQTEAISRPYVTVSHSLGSDGIIYLGVGNNGQSSAENLKLTISDDFYQLGVNHEQYKLSNLKAFANPVRHLPPGTKLTFALKSIDQVVMTQQVILPEKPSEAPTPSSFSITAEYSYGSKTVEEVTYIDVSLYHGTFKEIDAVVRQLGGIQKELHQIGTVIPR
jgi:hypothetical protein